MTSAPAARVLNELRMAFLTLSRLPVGRIAGEAPAMGASAWAWPLVGAAIGLIAAIVDCAALRAGLPPFLAAALAILALVLATGGLHEDGLADLADGFWGGRDAARRLEIMRDSRIGSYGALALGFSLLIRVGALASLPHGMGGAALVGLSAASRAAMPVALWLLPPARQDGLGRAAGGIEPARVAAAVGLGVAILALCLPAGKWLALPVMAAAAAGLGLLARRKIGGQTGDVLGATQQVAELAGWLVLAAQ